MLDVAVVVMQVFAGAIGLAWLSAMVVGMWRESRVLAFSTTAVSLAVLVGLLVAGGGVEGANELVLGGFGG